MKNDFKKISRAYKRRILYEVISNNIFYDSNEWNENQYLRFSLGVRLRALVNIFVYFTFIHAHFDMHSNLT